MLSDAARNRVRMAQLMVGSLLAGVIVTTVAMAFVVQQRGGGPAPGGGGAAPGAAPSGATGGGATTGADSMLIALAVLTVVMLPMAYIVMPLVRRKLASLAFRTAPAEIDAAERLAQPWMTYALISAAMVEGVGLFGAVVYFLTARPEALGAPAAAVVAMLLMFPTMGRFRSFVRDVTGRPELEM